MENDLVEELKLKVGVHYNLLQSLDKRMGEMRPPTGYIRSASLDLKLLGTPRGVREGGGLGLGLVNGSSATATPAAAAVTSGQRSHRGEEKGAPGTKEGPGRSSSRTGSGLWRMFWQFSGGR